MNAPTTSTGQEREDDLIVDEHGVMRPRFPPQSMVDCLACSKRHSQAPNACTFVPLDYRVLYVKEWPHAFKAPDTVRLADYQEIAIVVASDLDDLFRRMNVVDGTELPMTLKCRSMSVGDVAIDKHGDAYYCAVVGWRKVVLRSTVRVTVDGGHSWATEINGTEDQIRDYFRIGMPVNVGAEKDDVRKVVNLEFLTKEPS